MASIKIVTINISCDLSYWQARRGLILRDLREIEPDVVALQEARIPEKTAEWLAETLGYSHLFLTPKTGNGNAKEGIVIMSQIPFKSTDWLDLGSQTRVAQKVVVEIDKIPVTIVNGHYYWEGDAEARLAQVETMLKWVRKENASGPVVACGDFNDVPDSLAINRMLEEFESAHVVANGDEPDHTYPTPIKFLHLTKVLREFWYGIVRNYRLKPWRGTLDYIFINSYIDVLDCKVVLNTPADYHRRMYPSDHFGVLAVLQV